MSKASKVLILEEAAIVDSASSPILYVGKAAPLTPTSSAAWKIMKLDTSAGLVLQYAATGSYDQIWDNRLSLSYS